jgi:hypothetical protein
LSFRKGKFASTARICDYAEADERLAAFSAMARQPGENGATQVNRRGVCYDVGTVYSGFPWRVTTRPVFDPELTRRELEIIKTELHCNAVRIVGHDIGRLMQATEAALRLGLEVWLSPALYEKNEDETLGYFLSVAKAAEELRTRLNLPGSKDAPGQPGACDETADACDQPQATGSDQTRAQATTAHPAGSAQTGAQAATAYPAGPGQTGAQAAATPATQETQATGAGQGAPEPADEHSEELCAQCPGALCLRARLRSRQQVSAQIVFCPGGELSLFMRGIVPGRSIPERVANMIGAAKAGDHTHTERLNAFLGQASEAIRRVFGGPVSYAALVGESVDWSPFDFIGLDHYRDARIKDRYADMLQPFFGSGQPVVVTEVGMRGYRGAEDSGTLGFGVIDQRSQFLHQLPLVGRLVRARLNGEYVRDEGLQARELAEILGILDAAGVDGVFVSSFVEPLAPYSDDPRYDLDMSALSLVKSYTGRHGVSYPDMPWEPKEAFEVVAGCYAGQPANA